MISALLSKFSVVTTYHQRSTSRIVSFTTRLISKAARSAANNKTPVVINEDDLEEKFVRGHGPGGQSINKTRNNVQLRHIPTGIFVECQEQRELSQNRKIARKVLKDKIDLAVNGANSKLGLRHAKKKRNKRKSARYACCLNACCRITCPTWLHVIMMLLLSYIASIHIYPVFIEPNSPCHVFALFCFTPYLYQSCKEEVRSGGRRGNERWACQSYYAICSWSPR